MERSQACGRLRGFLRVSSATTTPSATPSCRPLPGVGIYPLGALLNHSCQPTAVQVFRGRNIYFKALDDLPAGTEATITYVELAATRPERRARLRQSYHFDINARGDPPAVPEEPEPVWRGHGSLVMRSWGFGTQGVQGGSPLEMSLSVPGGETVDCFVYTSPPEELDAIDVERLAAVRIPGYGNKLPGCGALVHLRGSPSTPESSVEARVLVRLWGPAFVRGGRALEARSEYIAQLLADLARGANAALTDEQPTRASCFPLITAAQKLEELDGHGAPVVQGRDGLVEDTGEGAVVPDGDHILVLSMYRGLMGVSIEERNWEEALELAERLTKPYQRIYQPRSPNLGVHYARVAKLADLVEGQEQLAVRAARTAYSILDILYPNDLLVESMYRIILRDQMHREGG